MIIDKTRVHEPNYLSVYADYLDDIGKHQDADTLRDILNTPNVSIVYDLRYTDRPPYEGYYWDLFAPSYHSYVNIYILVSERFLCFRDFQDAIDYYDSSTAELYLSAVEQSVVFPCYRISFKFFEDILCAWRIKSLLIIA